MASWKKLGNVFCPSGELSWMLSHASTPTGEFINTHLLRVYFTSRDILQRSHISFLDLNMTSLEVEYLVNEPVLQPGPLGSFDDSGVAMGCLLEFDHRKLLYYVGWNLKVTVPWLNTIGLAILNPDTGKFEKYSRAPIMDRSDEDPYSISYPSIVADEGLLRMWYASNLKWGADQEMQYVIKYAESKDGLTWKRKDKVALNLQYAGEFVLARPSVIKEKDKFKMWYSYRGKNNIDAYRIGYAESVDGLNWVRKDDESGIDVSPEGWDSEMVCYPYVFDYSGERYMLYNGNGYGKTGFGLAILER